MSSRAAGGGEYFQDLSFSHGKFLVSKWRLVEEAASSSSSEVAQRRSNDTDNDDDDDEDDDDGDRGQAREV